MSAVQQAQGCQLKRHVHLAHASLLCPVHDRHCPYESMLAVTKVASYLLHHSLLPALKWAAVLQEHCNEKVIIYFLTCASVDFFYAALSQLPQMATAQLHALHGRMKQQAREGTMTAYSTGTAGRLGLAQHGSCTHIILAVCSAVGCTPTVQCLPCQPWLHSMPQKECVLS